MALQKLFYTTAATLPILLGQENGDPDAVAVEPIVPSTNDTTDPAIIDSTEVVDPISPSDASATTNETQEESSDPSSSQDQSEPDLTNDTSNSQTTGEQDSELPGQTESDQGQSTEASSSNVSVDDGEAVLEKRENFDTRFYDEDHLFKDSRLNIGPDTAFYLNELVGLVLLATSSLLYFLGDQDTHQRFLWVMHTYVFGQNQVFWLFALAFDTEFFRMMYFRSSLSLAVIPYIVMPVYLLWLIFEFMTDRDNEYSTLVQWLIFASWSAYLYATSVYTHSILSSIHNYWMVLVSQDLERVMAERANLANELAEQDETNAFTSSEEGFLTEEDLIIQQVQDEWIFL